MALIKVTYSMIEGAPINVLDYGADPTGSNDSTAAIQAALDIGGAVYLPEGTYKLATAPIVLSGTRASLGISSNTTLFGSGKLYSTYSSGATLIIANDNSGSITNVTIDGIQMATDLSYTDYGYSMINFIQPATNIIVKNCRMTDFTYYGIVCSGNSAKNIIIENNILLGSRATGIWVGYDPEDIVIRGNIIDGTSVATYGTIDDRIFVGNHNATISSTKYALNVVIEGNVCIRTDSKGIGVGSIDNCVINGNTINYCRVPIGCVYDAQLTLGNRGVIISNNTIRNSRVISAYLTLERHAIWCQKSRSVSVINNKIVMDDSGEPAWRGFIWFDTSSQKAHIVGNSMYVYSYSAAYSGSGDSYAIYSNGSEDSTISDNFIFAINASPFVVGIYADGAASTQICNNNLYQAVNPGTGILFSGVKNVTIDNNKINQGWIRGVVSTTSIKAATIKNNTFINPGDNAGSGSYGIRTISLSGASSTYFGVDIEWNNEMDSRVSIPSFLFDDIVYIENTTNYNNAANKNTNANNINRR